jgi:cyclase
MEVFGWAKRVEELGAGEILLTSIDREGTGHGFNLDLSNRVAQSVSIPVIACGGAGKVEDVSMVLTQGKADAVCIASILHYGYLRNNYSEDDYSSEGNIEYLLSGQGFSHIQGVSLEEIKMDLAARNIPCRPIEETPINV